ncbi:glycosyltransferase family 4 protein [Rhodococcus sp. X156]|uniref:glycosyltransferase family 4 protein n=1 Tax=Rhodococcus sp. X156 TaxID=2499145 RepID=UPI000FDBDC61|nr:glycosyltransferase family 4 protein [Rhodococcus sp. X156]
MSAAAPAPLVLVNATANVSGAEGVLLDLLELAVQRGHPVTLACPPGPLAARRPAGVTHLPLPALGLGGGRALGAARLAARWAQAARVLRPAVRRPGARTVVNSLLALPAVRLAAPTGGASWLVHDTVHQAQQRLVVRAGRAGLRRVVAVSTATATPLRALGLPVQVVGNGVSWPVDAVPTTTLHHPPVVGCLALLTPWKGHAVLLEAVAQLPEVHLELAGGAFPGDAVHAEGLRRRAAQPDLAGRVRFLGHVAALDAMRGWDVCVSASTSPEACPLSVLEALSLGVPVVGTDHGGTSELLREGAGLLVPPGDVAALAAALTRVLDDAGLRAETARCGRARVAAEHDRSHTLPRMLDELLPS